MNIRLLYYFTTILFVSCSSEHISKPKTNMLSVYDCEVLNETVFSNKKNINMFEMTIPINVQSDDEGYFILNDSNKIFLDSMIYLVDSNELKNINCINQLIFDSIMSIKEGLIEQDGNILVIDRWNEFNKKFGGIGIHSVSKPMYNIDTSHVLINHYFIGGASFEFSELLLYEKIDNKWAIKPDSIWKRG